MKRRSQVKKNKERVKMEISFSKAAAAPQSAPHALPNEASVVSSRSAVKNMLLDGVSRTT